MMTKTIGNTLVVYENGEYIGQIVIGARRRSQRTKWHVTPRASTIDDMDFDEFDQATSYLIEQTKLFNAKGSAPRRGRPRMERPRFRAVAK